MEPWNKKECMNFFAKTELFKGLPEASREELADKAKHHRFAANQTIVRRGEGGNSLYVVVSGKVRVTLESPKVDQAVSILEAGDFFGEIGMMTQARRTATVTSVGETVVLEFSADDILTLARKYSDFKTRLTSAGAKRSTESLEKLING